MKETFDVETVTLRMIKTGLECLCVYLTPCVIFCVKYVIFLWQKILKRWSNVYLKHYFIIACKTTTWVWLGFEMNSKLLKEILTYFWSLIKDTPQILLHKDIINLNLASYNLSTKTKFKHLRQVHSIFSAWNNKTVFYFLFILLTICCCV